jgi:hypothetical protein
MSLFYLQNNFIENLLTAYNNNKNNKKAHCLLPSRKMIIITFCNILTNRSLRFHFVGSENFKFNIIIMRFLFKYIAQYL